MVVLESAEKDQSRISQLQYWLDFDVAAIDEVERVQTINPLTIIFSLLIIIIEIIQ